MTDLSACRWIALNGANYSLAPWFEGSRVDVWGELWWTPRLADVSAELLSAMSRPVCLIGFSRGAAAAVRIAKRCPYVKYVFAHSPPIKGSYVTLSCPVTVLSTLGDLTPCAIGSMILAKKNNTQDHILRQADWPDRELSSVEQRMKALNHQFHNVIPWLRREHPFLWTESATKT